MGAAPAQTISEENGVGKRMYCTSYVELPRASHVEC
jgi:hypothetical protein